MKIAVVSFGHSDSALSMVKALSGKSHVTHFLSFAQNRKRNNVIDFQALDVSCGLQPQKINNQVFYHELDQFINERFRQHLFIYHNLKLYSFRNLLLSFRFARILRRYNVIHFNGFNAVLPHLMLFLCRKKMIFTIHDVQHHSGEYSRFGYYMVRYLLWSKHPVILQNRNDFTRIQHQYPEKSESLYCIPFGKLSVYKFFSGHGAGDHDSDFLFFGRVSKYKGIEYLVEAVKRIHEKYPNLKVIIAGGGDYHFDIKKKIDGLPVKLLHRFIPTHELVGLIQRTSVVVCPYTDATQSGVVMTAYVFNRPVIATNVGGFEEVVKNGVHGFLVPPRDDETLAEAMSRMLDEPDLLDNMRRNIENDQDLEDFKWDKIADSIISVYNNLV
ncbi:MAG: glycosyltransferase family 4 protein [Bacteroidales bacterium]|nr:MAG: glycosyltransferase family 4 protein [Bacteroidales bacterium]